MLKSKWKNIKDHYRKELKKIPPTRSGDAATDCVSTWKHFRQMSFMKDQIQPSRSESNITTHLTSDSGENDDTQDSSDINVASPLSCISASSPALSTSAPSTSSRGKKRKSANELRSEFLEIEKKRLLLLQNKERTPRTQETQEPPKSDDYHYLMSLLPQMEQFKGIQKMRVRNKINSIIMAEMQAGSISDPYMTQYGYHTAPPDNTDY